MTRHSLHWECGLKLLPGHGNNPNPSHSLHWECGLKLRLVTVAGSPSRHSLHWECGLKLTIRMDDGETQTSLPSLGVWIETSYPRRYRRPLVSLPSLGVWIETCGWRGGFLPASGHSLHWECGLKHEVCAAVMANQMSLPSLGVWIETSRS